MKNNKIWLIVFLTILAIVIIGVMSLLILKVPITFHGEGKVILQKQFDGQEIRNIVIHGVSSDVSIVEHDADYYEVEIYGDEKDEVKAEVEQRDLKISQDGNTFCLAFCFGEKKIVVKTPKNASFDVDVTTTSGDIDINPYSDTIKVKSTSGDIDVLQAADTHLLTVSGDIEVGKSDKAVIETTSGDIELKEVTSTLDIQTTSGDIDVYKANLISDSSIHSVSGDVYVKLLNEIYVETKTTSGDVHVENNNRHAEMALNITTTSGDIKVNN